VATVGATASAASARLATKEFLGESDGAAGQRFYLSGTPVLLPLRPSECLRVKSDENDDCDEELWRYVESFVDSHAHSQHFTLDSMSGEVRFGPAIRQPNGEIKQYGKTPPRGARLFVERYRYLGNQGDTVGGFRANVPKKSINILRTSIPYVDRVENRLSAIGGIDGQSVESAQLAVQRLIRTRRLLITPDDYEARVQEQFFDRIGRVKCIPVTSDPKTAVRILLLPVVPPPRPENLYGYLTNADLHVPATVRGEVDAFLNERRMLAVQVRVENCTYRRVLVVATLRLQEGASQRAVEQNALRRLHTLLHPITGGVQGRGWPFERTLTAVEVKAWLSVLAGVESVERVELQEVEDVGPNRTAEGEQRGKAPGTEIKLAVGEMLVSGHHRITWTR
jgi:predicted phage baseplate assembly protein